MYFAAMPGLLCFGGKLRNDDLELLYHFLVEFTLIKKS
jgi:hypothetical protein